MPRFNKAIYVALFAITFVSGAHSVSIDFPSKLATVETNSIAARYPLRARTPSLFERSKGKSAASTARQHAGPVKVLENKYVPPSIPQSRWDGSMIAQGEAQRRSLKA